MISEKSWAEVVETASGDVRRLSYVTRYSSIPVNIAENVAEHSFYVGLYSVLVHKCMRPNDDETIGAILLKSITHDLAECITGDIVRTFKYSSIELKSAIDKAEEKIINQFPLSVTNLLKKTQDILSDGNENYVKAVVKAGDFMSLHQYMIREVRRGNREIIHPFYMRMIEDLSETASDHKKSDNKEMCQLAGLYEEMVNTAKTVRSGG